ncbi:MAG: isoamylase early set domain-containing protein [Bacteroidota bacterium]
MSFSKKFLKSKPVCKVTFKLKKQFAPVADNVALVGDFNDWDHEATPMKALKSGGFSTTLDLEQGKEYQFRYLVDGNIWANDEAADKYVQSPFPDAENSVLVL